MADQFLLRRREVERRVGKSRSAIYAAVRAGEFPRPVAIGRRAVAWRLTDIQEWIDARPLANAHERGCE